jgi:hypothetical protein
MRTAIVAAATWLLSGLAVAADTPAAIPKQGNLSGSQEVSGPFTSMHLGTDRLHLTWDVTGVRTSDSGDILHNAKVRCLGSFLAVNDIFDNELDSCIYTRPDGDQVFAVVKGTGKVGGEALGTVTLVGGTGKLVGITGSMEFTRTSVIQDGANMKSTSRSRGTYKLLAEATPR